MANPRGDLEKLERKYDISKEDLEGPKIDRRTTIKLMSLGGMSGMAASLAGCSEDQDPTGNGDPTYGGTLHTSTVTNQFENLLAWLTRVKEYNLVHNTVNALTILDENGEIVPDVATDWQMKDDTTWEYDLREDVSFHDEYGDVIAEDFVWSIERLQETDESPYITKVAPIERIEATDDYRLEISFEHPFAPWPVYSTRNSNATVLVSQQYMDEVGQDEYTRMPIGTGPFKFDERQAGEFVKVVRYEDYHETDEDDNQLPYLDEIYFNAIPEPSTQWSALQSNDIQFIRNMPPALANQVEDSGAAENMTFNPINAGYWYCLSMLCNDPAEHTDWVEWLGGEVTDKWQDQEVPTFEPEVRQAISKAIDREKLAEDAYFGYADAQHTMWNPHMFGYDELEENSDVGQYFDPEGAEELLDDAGYTADPRLSLSLLAPTDREREMTVIQQQLAEVGIDVELDIRPEADYWAAIYSFNNMVSAYSGGAFFTNDESWRRQLHTPTQEGDGTYQKGLYSNEDLDEIMDQTYKTLDEEEKLQLLREGSEIITREAPYVMTVGPENIQVWRDELNGFRSPVGATFFDRAWLDE